MLPVPQRQEIDHRTIKLIVGLIALSLATLTSVLAPNPIASISAAYHEGGWSQSIFLGFLFAISAFLLAYNGQTPTDMVLSKVAAGAALGVALYPCACGDHQPQVPLVHGASAALMFLILAYFCLGFYQRAMAKAHPEARARAGIYAACGLAIVLAILVLATDAFLQGRLSQAVARLVFYGEATGLIAFGISWLTASRTLPVITRQDERFSPMRAANPA